MTESSPPVRAVNDSTKVNGSDVDLGRTTLALIAGCFFVSGFSALLYETVWLRQFAILLGTSEQALAIVLSSYMGGLALGSWIASRFVNQVRRPLLTYGVLELGIAVAALLLPVGLSGSRVLQRLWLGGLAEPPPAGTAAQMIFNLVITAGLILIPTTLMGATLPLLARHVVRRDEELGPRIGMLYAINTAGAVVGTLSAAFLLMPSLGMRPTTWVGAAGNAMVFALVIWLARLIDGTVDSGSVDVASADAQTVTAKTGQARPEPRRPRGTTNKSPVDRPNQDGASEPAYHRVLILIAFSGAISFCYEILFTRMLGHLLGGSIFAFATMLSGFLAGIAIGGAVCSRLAVTRRAAAIGFVNAQVGSAMGILLAFHVVDSLAGWDWTQWGGTSNTLVQVLTSIVILLPTAIAVGASFPFAIRVFARDETQAAAASARVYAMSTIGGIIGSLLTGAVLMPMGAYHGSTALAVIANLSIATAAIIWFRVPRRHGVVAVVGLVILLLAFPKMPENVIRVSSLNGKLTPGRIAFNSVGKSATVTVLYQDGEMRFQTNGLPESGVGAVGGALNYRHSGAWLATLPSVVRPSIDSMMIIGLGGGVAASAVPPSVASVDVVEISDSVLEANRAVAPVRDRDPLQDDRIRIVLNDARNALALTDKTYDSIVSQPSHPWTAGASHLYTREFAAIVRRHLNPGGIFLQWMASDFVNDSLVASMSATLLDVFPFARMYQPQPGLLLFVASDQPIRPEWDPDWSIPDVDVDAQRRMGIETQTHLLATLSLDDEAMQQVAQLGDVIRDERNLLAMQAPFLVQQNDGDAVKAFIRSFHPATRGVEALASLCPTVDLFPLGQRMMAIGQADETAELIEPIMTSDAHRGLLAALRRRAEDGSAAWKDYLESQFDTDDPLVAYHILHADAIGKLDTLNENDRARLMECLESRHRRVLPIIAETFRNQLDSARTQDEFLSTFSVDDQAFETILKIRLPWRLESQPPDQLMRCQEVIGLIDSNAAYINELEVAYFRMVAAIQANQSLTALTTAYGVAKMIETMQRDQGSPIEQGTFNHLFRVRRLLQQPSSFPYAPRERFREVARLVEDVSASAIDARLRAGMPIVYPNDAQ